MTKKKSVAPVEQEPVAEETVENMVQISVEQILAAIVASKEQVEIPLADLIKDYTGKQISVDQDGDLVVFRLVDLPVEDTQDAN